MYRKQVERKKERKKERKNGWMRVDLLFNRKHSRVKCSRLIEFSVWCRTSENLVDQYEFN